VTFFFILSGFLITLLMFKEQIKYGSLNIVSFYVRRVLRIWPLYYITLLIGFCLYPFFLSYSYHENASQLLYLLFATNFDHIYNGNPSIGILGVQWSVAIEEQFYLIWPLIFYFLNKLNAFPFALLVLLMLSEMFWCLSDNAAVRYYHLVSNLRYLSFGALLAYLCFFYYDQVISFLNRINYPLVYLCSLTILLLSQKLTSIPVMKQIVHFLPLLFFGFVIIEQSFSKKSFFKIGEIKILTWLGKISYGVYLLHMVAVYVVKLMLPKEDGFALLKVSLVVILTILFSYLSYMYIEKFFLSFKTKFSRN